MCLNNLLMNGSTALMMTAIMVTRTWSAHLRRRLANTVSLPHTISVGSRLGLDPQGLLDLLRDLHARLMVVDTIVLSQRLRMWGHHVLVETRHKVI